MGILALLAGAAALVLARFNPTGIDTVPHLPIRLPLATAVAMAAVVLALIAFLAAASSPRTGTGIPLLAILICGGALLLSWKPNLLTRPVAPVPVQPAQAAPKAPAVVAAPPEDDPPHVKTMFDMDSSSTPTPSAKSSLGTSDSSTSTTGVPSAAATGAKVPRPDRAAAILAARARFQSARDRVTRAMESSPAYRAATSDADDAEAELKKARLAYEPGSSELIAASQAALQAHAKVQRLISDALSRDPAAQDAAREMQAAQGSR